MFDNYWSKVFALHSVQIKRISTFWVFRHQQFFQIWQMCQICRSELPSLWFCRYEISIQVYAFWQKLVTLNGHCLWNLNCDDSWKIFSYTKSDRSHKLAYCKTADCPQSRYDICCIARIYIISMKCDDKGFNFFH